MSQQPIIDTVRLLLLHESQDEAELLLNTLRKAGKATRAEFARSEDGLVSLLKGGEWDAVLARPGAALPPAKVIAHARKLGHDIPVIILADDNESATILAGLKAGARDVVPKGETERLTLVLEREMAVLAMRREKIRLEADLRESERRSELLMDSAQDAVAYVTDGMHIEANSAYASMFGYADPEELAGVPIMDLVADSAHKELKDLLRRLPSTRQGDKHEITCPCLHSGGKTFDATMVFSPATFDGEPCIQILIRSAVTAGASEAEIEARLREAATLDQLTGLRNRSFFMTQVDEAVAAAKARRKVVTLLFVQIDNFTNLRTSVGLGGADAVLTEIAGVLRGLVTADKGELARFGDDLFAALVEVPELEQARAFAEQMRKAVEAHIFEVQKKTIQVTASIGATLIDDATRSGQDALTFAADAAAKVRQKNNAGNGVFVYNPADLIDASTDSGMAKHLQIALEKNQFKLYYQPILNLEENAEETYEVLLRLPLKDKELAPAEFLQAAAAGNINTKIDRWVILNALKVLAEHNAKGHKSRIMVTLTSDSLADQSLVQWLGVALKAARVDGSALILQFNEVDAATYLRQATQFVKDVSVHKILTALNRFGASNVTIKVLDHLPEIHYVKLDGSFIQELNTDAGKQAISKAVKDIQGHKKRVIASHVESAAALQSLWTYGINYIEGYYVSPALTEMNYPFADQ